MNSKLINLNTLRKIIFTAGICICTLSLFAQGGRTVVGTVVDTNGEPVVGAAIAVKGTTTGVISDTDGKFSLHVDPNAVLVVSYLGYKTQEVRAGNQSALSIVLTEDSQLLEDVVIIGYGAQKKVNLTGAVATVNTGEIQNMPVSNLTAALSGKLPGVTITQFTGSPGTSSSLTVRAKGTWNNTDPLYVINGVVRDKFAFDGLSANDVENISVLKDGASAAIYGARAANGVILVTTKKGVTGKPVINYSGSIGTSSPTKIAPTQNSYNQAVLINDYLDQQDIDKGDTRYFTTDELDYFKTHNWSWLDESLRNPVTNHHSLNVSGGNDRVRYFVGGSYHYETGIFDKINYNKSNLRGSIEANITKDLIASLDLNMDNRLMQRSEWRYDAGNDTQYDLFKALLMRTGQVPPYVDGLPVGLPFVEWHPLEIISGNGGYDRKKYGNYEATVSLQYNIPFIEGLSVKLLYNKYDAYYFRKEFRLPYYKYQFQTTGGHGHILDLANPTIVGQETRNDGNMLQERQQMDFTYQLNGFITYNRTFGKHDVGAVLVYEQSEGTNDWFQAERQNYLWEGIPIDDRLDQLNTGSATPAILPTGSGSETGRLSYIGRLNYGYDSKYLLEASFRYDGSVNFAPSKRWGFFPSVSAGWRISEEGFFKDHVKFIDYLKLRGSFGMLGNDAVGGWQWAQRYNLTTGQYYGVSSNGLQVGAISNPYITWEKSASYNGGLDAAFLNSKLSVGIDAFYRHSYDILGSRLAALPTTFGATMPSENYATINTKGFELELGYNDRIEDVDYYVKGNLGYAVNKLIFQDEAENLRPYQSKIGLNTDIAMGYVATDIIRTQADLDALPADYTIFGSKPELGMLNFKDIRGPNSDTPDGVIDSNDQDWIQRHTAPPLTYGFGFGGSWKGFSLDLFFQGVGNYDVMITSGSGARGINARQVETNIDFWTDHWTSTNPNASFPKVYNNQANNASTFWRRNGAYLRLKNVTLSYNLPKSLSENLKLGQCKIFVEGLNPLLLMDHIKYFDPELGNTGNNMYLYPITKSYSVGINLSF
jgi:TonB-linked SusC/RagA family outer membrane protein